MMAPLVMLAQKIFAVVVAVRRAHDYVDMIFVGLLVLAKRNAPLMVELNDNDWALDSIIKNTVVVHAAHPAKVSIPQVLLYFFHSHPSMIRSHASNVQLKQTKQQVVLRTGQFVVANAGEF